MKHQAADRKQATTPPPHMNSLAQHRAVRLAPTPEVGREQATFRSAESSFTRSFSTVPLRARNERASSDRVPPTLAASQRHSGEESDSANTYMSRSLPAFPYQAQIEQALDLPIAGHAVVDSVACAQHGTPAFTQGATTYFATPSPSLKIAAHEAAHLAQHMGLTHDANLGAEKHAAIIAHRIAADTSAYNLIGRRGLAITPDYHPYTEIPLSAQTIGEWDASMDVRVSEDRRMAVGQDSPMHSFWADAPKIAESNSILTSRKSVIRLVAQPDQITGTQPNGSTTRILSRVLPKNVANATTGENMNIWADCGKSGRDVMGAGEGTGGGYSKMTAVFREQKKPWWASIPILGPLLGWIIGMPKPQQKETSASSPESMKEEMFNERLGGTGDEGLKKYMALPPAERERFDQQTGINRYAAPATGEGYTMSSGGNPVPGNRTWNFHWGGVVMVSGADRVTLENYAVGDPSVQNSDWEYQMYGSAVKPGQTFHEQHQATGQHGAAPTTMQVRRR